MNQTVLAQKAAQLNELAAQAETLEKRYSAHVTLYEAACMAGNDDEITQRREECHTLLDSILDNIRDVHFATRAVRKLLEGG